MFIALQYFTAFGSSFSSFASPSAPRYLCNCHRKGKTSIGSRSSEFAFEEPSARGAHFAVFKLMRCRKGQLIRLFLVKRGINNRLPLVTIFPGAFFKWKNHSNHLQRNKYCDLCVGDARMHFQ